MNKALYNYCCSCGLCAAIDKANLVKDNKGFYHPVDGDEAFLKKICPCYGNQLSDMDSSQIWGKHIKAYYGWSTNNEVRFKASSGGILTEIACYLIKENLVDYVIQTTYNSTDPTKTVTKVSSTIDEVRACCGSRYAISHPLEILNNIDVKKRYAFIGKPCDITILKNYIKTEPNLGKCII